MKSTLLLPIHSKHARQIYSHNKQYEYRKSAPSRDIGRIAIYETSPVSMVTGYVEVIGIIEGSPSFVWDITKNHSGVSRAFFRDYYSNKKSSIAFVLGTTASLDSPLPLSDLGIKSAPQSRIYLSDVEEKTLLNSPAKMLAVRPKRLFVGGVHGVGKSAFVSWLSQKMSCANFSSSELIKQHASLVGKAKAIQCSEINSNQDLLISSLSETSWFGSGGLLDGHFVLATEEGSFSKIPIETFRAMELDEIMLLYSKPSRIAMRLIKRDGPVSADLAKSITNMQSEERVRAYQVAKELGLPLSCVYR